MTEAHDCDDNIDGICIDFWFAGWRSRFGRNMNRYADEMMTNHWRFEKGPKWLGK